MTDRRSQLVKNWLRAKLYRQEKKSTPLDAGSSLPGLTRDSRSTSDSTMGHANLTNIAESVVDNISLALELVQQITTLAQNAPIIGPIAALVSGILKAYKEVKDADEKRDVLFTHIANLTRDLCATVLRMEAMNHVDLIGRLAPDMDAYAGLLGKASDFIKEYDKQPVVIRFAARNQLGTKLGALTQELELFGARFKTNRLIDLALNERANTAILGSVQEVVVKEKLEQWLKPPDMGLKHLEMQRLRQEGTGLWLLGGAQFMEWQDHPGSLWIMGPSGAGNSVLCSAVITKLIADTHPFDLEKTFPVAFFYFDFKDKEGHVVESALRRIVLQLSAHSPNPYKVLDKLYMVSKGQTLPTYQDLRNVLESLLLELGRTYIILDALDECKEADLDQILDFISMLRSWTRTPLHLLITSQPRSFFTTAFEDMACVVLDSDVTGKDIRFFVSVELRKPKFKIWSSRADDITERVVRKNDLFGVYDRFLEAIRPTDSTYVVAVLRWLLFAEDVFRLDQLADAIAFDFSDAEQFTYEPARRHENWAAILEWLEGPVVLVDDHFHEPHVGLAHASVQDYILSPRFTKFSPEPISELLSHTFIARTCISYLLHFSNHPLTDGTQTSFRIYPSGLAKYATRFWSLRLLEDESDQYSALERYIEGARELLANGADVHIDDGSMGAEAAARGYTDIVHLLLDHNANVNAMKINVGSALAAACWSFVGSALQGASWNGDTDIVHLLLAHDADVDAIGGHFDSALRAAIVRRHTGIVHVLLDHKADVNKRGRYNRSPLLIAIRLGNTDIVRLLLDHEAEVNERSDDGWTPLLAAIMEGNTEIVRLLLVAGADVNVTGDTDNMPIIIEDDIYQVNPTGGETASALQVASLMGSTELVDLLLKNGANVNATSGKAGDLQVAWGYTAIVEFLLRKGVDENETGGIYGSALQAASACGWTSIVQLLLQSGRLYGSALQAAAANSEGNIAELLIGYGADVDGSSADYTSAFQLASQGSYTAITELLLRYAAPRAESSEPGSPVLAADIVQTVGTA
ncbi:ankyrin repeat-containing domain protein [Mycena vulgaris]|nr:ankyrin repeat-containing domain protein [Mycena vulgaris]